MQYIDIPKKKKKATYPRQNRIFPGGKAPVDEYAKENGVFRHSDNLSKTKRVAFFRRIPCFPKNLFIASIVLYYTIITKTTRV